MKHIRTRKYFTVTFIAQYSFLDEEYAIVYAYNEEEAEQMIREILGDVIAITVRRSTLKECLYAKTTHPNQTIVAI